MSETKRPSRRKVNLDRVRRRLYDIAIDGVDTVAVQAARILLREAPDAAEKPDRALLDDLFAELRNRGEGDS